MAAIQKHVTRFTFGQFVEVRNHPHQIFAQWLFVGQCYGCALWCAYNTIQNRNRAFSPITNIEFFKYAFCAKPDFSQRVIQPRCRI